MKIMQRTNTPGAYLSGQRPVRRGNHRGVIHQYACSSIRYYLGSLLFIFLLQVTLVQAAELRLDSIEFSTLPGDRLQLQLNLNGPAFKPKVFHTENPARIVLDLPGVTNALKRKTISINMGVTSTVNAIEGTGRTRVVINLLSMAPYEVKVEGDNIYLVLQNSGTAAAPLTVEAPTAPSDALPLQTIENIDFKRGPKGEGRVLIYLVDPNAIVDLREEGGRIVANFMNTKVAPGLAKKLDVTDFATPVKTIETISQGALTRTIVTPISGDYDYSSYQTDRLLTLEFRPLTRAEKEEIKKKIFPYTGERLSLNFQDIPVRSVLQILADFTNLNIVASDSVKGNVTLRLNDVPWDQALELILKSKGLAKRQEGNIVRVAPADEIIKQEKEELEALNFKERLEPLKTEIIQINYARAADIKKVLMGIKEQKLEVKDDAYAGTFPEEEPAEIAGEALSGGSILSKRGTVNIDERTNILIVKDTSRNIEAVRKLVRELDKPVRQVLIESRIVIANTDFTREMGVRLEGNKDFKPNDAQRDIIGNALVDLPAAVGPGSGGALGFTLFKMGEYLLDLELSALQNEGRGEVVSNPRVITSDGTTASIEQGVEIPFATSAPSDSGGTNVPKTQFKKAVMKLEVTPQITPDDTVVMDLLIKKDEPRPTPLEGSSGPPIDTREIQTTVQVSNGETVVLGGIYEGNKSTTINKVPLFGDLPVLGFLFKKSETIDNKRELLVFITPKVLKQTLSFQ